MTRNGTETGFGSKLDAMSARFDELTKMLEDEAVFSDPSGTGIWPAKGPNWRMW